MIEKKEEFVRALKRMNAEKGMSAYSNPASLKASLADYASDSRGLGRQRTLFVNTMTAEINQGGNLLQTVRRLSEFDAEKQKNWMRWLKDVDIKEENIAFTIVCLLESVSLNKSIDKSLYASLENTSEKAGEPKRSTNKAALAGRKRRRTRITLLRVCGAVCIIAVIAATAFFSIRRSNESSDAAYTALKTAMESDDTQTITSSLADKTYGKKNEAAVEELVINYASKQCESFNDGTEDLNTAQNRINALKAGDFAENATVAAKYELLGELSESKSSYKYAMEYESKSKYGNAIDYFGRVIEDDSNYKDAQDEIRECKEKYADEVLEQYETYMSSEDYEKAESVLSTALATGYIDDPRINTSMTEVQGIISAKKQEQQQQEIDAALADIKTNCANDPVQMINNLKDLSSKYPDSSVVKDELASSKQSYKDSVMAGIDGVYASGGTGEVVNYLQTALDVMGPDGDVSAKLQEWKGHNKTIDLSTLDDFAHDSLYWRDTTYSLDYRTDSYGNVYDNILHAGWGGLSFIEYYIGDLNVRKLNFTAYLNKYGAQNAGEQTLSYMYIKVYGDDRLLYTFDSFYHTFEPTNMSVNVEGVKILRIETYKSTYMSMSNAYLSW